MNSNAQLLSKDKEYVWHPFTQVKTDGEPIPIVRASGSSLFDSEGTAYIDAISSWWVNLHGHNHPHIRKRIIDQLNTLHHVMFAGVTHPSAVELAERLVGVLPSPLTKIFFSDNGSTSVEVAVKMVLQYWWNKGKEKKKFIAFENGYHGDTFGAMSLGTKGAFSRPFEELLFEIIRISPPYPGKEEESLAQMREALKDQEIAGFIYEPLVQGAAGMLMYEPDALQPLLESCREANVLTIADEVMTGFGRTGTLFASEQIELPPDIICLSKALTGGAVPLGVTGCQEFIYEGFLSEERKKMFWHGHSFTGNPIACAAALGSLDLIEDSSLREGKSFLDSLGELIGKLQSFGEELKSCDNVANIRQTGIILAFEIKTDQDSKYLHPLRNRLIESFTKERILLRPLGNIVYILPPICITDAELERIFSAIRKTLKEVR